jgi:hypothetical protein
MTSSEKENQLHKLRSTNPAMGTKPRVKRRAAASGSRKSKKKTGGGAGNAD